MSKRTLVLQSAGGILGLVCLNLALAPIASAGDSCCGNMSNATGTNVSNASGSCHTNCTNESNASGHNGSNYSGLPPTECKDICNNPKPFTNVSNASGFGGSLYGAMSASIGGAFGAKVGGGLGGETVGGGSGSGGYSASTQGMSQQFQQLLTVAQNAYAQASAKVAEIQSRSTPSAQKDAEVRYSRVADANDCGCNAAASGPDSAELIAAKAAEAEAAASLAKAQEQARKFLESTKNSVAFGTSGPIW
jgi:hypothetical protein